MAATPRDILENSELCAVGPRLPCAGWVMCHVGFFGCTLRKPILADVSRVEFIAKILEAHSMDGRLGKPPESR